MKPVSPSHIHDDAVVAIVSRKKQIFKCIFHIGPAIRLSTRLRRTMQIRFHRLNAPYKAFHLIFSSIWKFFSTLQFKYNIRFMNMTQ